MTTVYDWSLAGPGEQDLLQVARYDFPPGQPSNHHCHQGYAEAAWVIAGDGWHHRNGTEQAIALGDLIFVREADAHHFIAGAAGLSVINAAIATALLDEAGRRLAGLAPWPWAANAHGSCQLGPVGLARLAAWAEDLAPHRLDLIDGLAFLTDLLRLPERSERRHGHCPPPPWLLAALRAWTADQAWHEGPGAFAGRCGRAVDHINRVVRAAYGCTTARLLQQARLDRAAARLRLGEDAVLTVALDTGFANQGHFHAAFKDRFGCTPRAWRLRHRLL